MKRAVVVTMSAMLLLSLVVNASFGRPPYKAQFDQTYKDGKIVAAAKDAKCNVCHYGTNKKNRNDYGTALSKILTKDGFEKLKAKPTELSKTVSEALKTVAKQKSVTGKTFGELIDAGKLPGTAPEDAQ